MINGNIYTNELISMLREQLEAAERILIVTHIRPDGDAIGSMLGLGIALLQAGKTVQMVCEDGVPGTFAYLDQHETVLKKPEGSFDLVVTLDCSDLERTGDSLKDVKPPNWNIDHHVTNQAFGNVNIVNPNSVATAEMVADLIDLLGLNMTKPVAEALLTGLITDTIGFQTSNMTSKALRLAADLMENGANLAEIYRQSLVVRSFKAIRLWANGLVKAQKEDGLIWTTLTKEDSKLAGYPGHDDADLIQVLSSVEDVNIAIIFVEQPKGRVKVSWRAQQGYDVSQIALKFGGGGHPAASGAELPGRIDEVKSMVISATRLLMEKKRNEQKF